MPWYGLTAVSIRGQHGRCWSLEPERILFGHGEGVLEDAEVALRDALEGARRRFPRALVTQFGTNLRLLVAAMGD
ncbi:hypothetical protein GRS80_11925 [Natrialba sp. INN-245]|nr:hypothetical protein [Natrialba sp. INN-245]